MIRLHFIFVSSNEAVFTIFYSTYIFVIVTYSKLSKLLDYS